MSIKSLFIIIAILFNNITSAKPYTEPDNFNASKNIFQTVIVTWEYTDNVQQACNRKSKEVGNDGFKFLVEACAFHYHDNVNQQQYCYIITNTNTTMSTLGHEIRHCFQIHFHQGE